MCSLLNLISFFTNSAMPWKRRNIPSAMSTKKLRLIGMYLPGTFGIRYYEGNVRSRECIGIVYKCQIVLQCMVCDNWFHLSSHTWIKVTLPSPVTWSYFSAWCMVLCNPLSIRWPFNQIPPVLGHFTHFSVQLLIIFLLTSWLYRWCSWPQYWRNFIKRG